MSSEKMAMLEEVGEEGLSVPAAYSPEDISGANDSADMIPVDKHQTKCVCTPREAKQGRTFQTVSALLGRCGAQARAFSGTIKVEDLDGILKAAIESNATKGSLRTGEAGKRINTPICTGVECETVRGDMAFAMIYDPVRCTKLGSAKIDEPGRDTAHTGASPHAYPSIRRVQ